MVNLWCYHNWCTCAGGNVVFVCLQILRLEEASLHVHTDNSNSTGHEGVESKLIALVLPTDLICWIAVCLTNISTPMSVSLPTMRTLLIFFWLPLSFSFDYMLPLLLPTRWTRRNTIPHPFRRISRITFMTWHGISDVLVTLLTYVMARVNIKVVSSLLHAWSVDAAGNCCVHASIIHLIHWRSCSRGKYMYVTDNV